MSPGANPASEQSSALRAEEPPKGSQGTALPCALPKRVFFSNRGGFPADLKHFTPSLWKSGLGKQASPSPSPHHPRVLEDSWTSHSVSQPAWA